MRNVVFSPDALAQLDEWKKANPKIVHKIITLITEISETPFTGTGKPEPLKHDLKGKWAKNNSGAPACL